MELTCKDIRQAAIEKGYIPMFPEQKEQTDQIEIGCIMAWLTVTHQRPFTDMILMLHRLRLRRADVLSDLHEKILSLN